MDIIVQSYTWWIINLTNTYCKVYFFKIFNLQICELCWLSAICCPIRPDIAMGCTGFVTVTAWLAPLCWYPSLLPISTSALSVPCSIFLPQALRHQFVHHLPIVACFFSVVKKILPCWSLLLLLMMLICRYKEGRRKKFNFYISFQRLVFLPM